MAVIRDAKIVRIRKSRNSPGLATRARPFRRRLTLCYPYTGQKLPSEVECRRSRRTGEPSVDASAVPHFRTGGPTAAAQTLGARERHTRGDTATMVDVTAGQGTGAASGNLKLSDIGNILKRGDIALALGILTILVVLILPLPSVVLDLFLAISITLSILILMTSLFIQAPLEFSSFPTILL